MVFRLVYSASVFHPMIRFAMISCGRTAEKIQIGIPLIIIHIIRMHYPKAYRVIEKLLQSSTILAEINRIIIQSVNHFISVICQIDPTGQPAKRTVIYHGVDKFCISMHFGSASSVNAGLFIVSLFILIHLFVRYTEQIFKGYPGVMAERKSQ